MKKIDTLVEDIYEKVSVVAEGEQLDVTDEAIDKFGEGMKEALKTWLTPREEREPTLRMSNIGRPVRQLWFDMNSPVTAQLPSPATMIKFLLGHLGEPLMTFLVELAGHTITDEQKEIKVKGIVGHMDCKIDGEVVDMKTASRFAFTKFANGTLAESDHFGYLGQLAGYEKNEGTNKGGFLVLNKEGGDICFFRPEELDKPNINVKIDKTKKIIKRKLPPKELCYAPVADGTYGNYKIAKPCNYCPHKFLCHKDANNGEGLRIFKYAKGRAYFTTVTKKPNVLEITHVAQRSESSSSWRGRTDKYA